jgi:hypothetical protein
MVGDFGLVFDNRQLDDVWLEFKEAGADYVRKGKEVTRDLFVIESSPSSQESANWSKQDWLDHAKELLDEIDKVSLKIPKKDKETNKWILDENGKKKLFGAPGFFRGTPLRPSIATHRTGKTTALIQRFCILCRRRKSDLTLHAALT